MANVKLIFRNELKETIQSDAVNSECAFLSHIKIEIESKNNPGISTICLDKSTAIRFVKELKRQIALLD